MIINTAGQRIGAQMTTAADGTPFTGAVTVLVTGDAGVQATGSVGAGACTHEGNGYHTYAPAQAETNYNLIAFTFTGSGAITATVQVFTVAGDPFTRLGAPAGASTAADIAAVKAETATILADTNDIQTRLPAALVGGRIDANMGAISSDAVAADNAEAFFDGTGYAGTGNTIPTVTTLTGHTPQTGDNFARLGAPAGASISADIAAKASQASVNIIDDFLDTEIAAILAAVDTEVAAILADTDDIQTRIPAALVLGRMDASVGAMAANVMTAAAAAPDLTTELQAGLATAAALDAVDNFIDTEIADIQARLPAALVLGRMDASVGAMAANVMTAAAAAPDLTTELQAGLATAASITALDAKIDIIDDYLDTEIAAILVDTGTTLDDLVDDLETRLTAALATKLAAHAAGVLVVVVGVGSTTTNVVLSTVEGGAASAVANFYNGAVLILTSGALAGQRTAVSNYDGANNLTVVALTGAPANGVTGLLV